MENLDDIGSTRTAAARLGIAFAVIAVAFIITVSHRPDAILNAQFWAEDGKFWYADAYNNGFLTSLFSPQEGYFQTFSRLVAGFCQLLPFEYAPLLFNLIAIILRSSLAAFIISPRLAGLLPALWQRVALAFIFVSLPHSFETAANLTNAQWNLALLAFLILVSKPASSAVGKVFDIVVLTVSALSGPLCLVLLPCALIKYFVQRERASFVRTIPILFGSIIQAVSLIVSTRVQPQPIGASVGLFFEIVGGHLFFNSIFGDRTFQWFSQSQIWGPTLAVGIVLVGASVLALAVYYAKLEFRLMAVFAILVIAGALYAPLISATEPQWVAMAKPTGGSRYWLIPSVMLFTAILTVARDAVSAHLRKLGFVLLIASAIGIVADWRHPRFADLEFPFYAAEFDRAAPGTEVVIPINPNWEMKLVKK